jgi:hypothetical protein
MTREDAMVLRNTDRPKKGTATWSVVVNLIGPPTVALRQDKLSATPSPGTR